MVMFSNVNLSAQGKIDYLAALNVDKRDVQSNSSSSWFGISGGWLAALSPDTFGLLGANKSESKDTVIQTRAATTRLQSEADILSQSGGNTRLQGTQVKAQTFTVNAGVGPKADPNAKIIIEGVKETLQTSHTEKSESLVWQAQSGNGVTEESLKLAQINAKTKFSAPGTYNFDLKGYSDVNSMASVVARTQRNVLTGTGLLVNGVGDSYNIYFKGSIPAPANLP